MNKKRLTDLVNTDLLHHHVWEHWLEDDIEYVAPTDKTEINEDSTKGHIVLTNFILNNGIKLTGFCSPQDTSGLDYIQPVMFTEKGQVELWKDSGWTMADKKTALKKIGLDLKDIFPIKYKALTKCDNKFYEGTLLDFNKGV